MRPTPPITSYRPREWFKNSRIDSVGSREAVIYGRHSLIEVLAYAGGQHGAAFTKFTTYLGERVHSASLPRRYHDRWILRLALDFEERCRIAVSKEGDAMPVV